MEESTSESPQTGAYFLLVSSAVMWGGNSVAIKLTLAEFPPLTAAAVRFLGISCLLVAALIFVEGLENRPKEFGDWVWLVMMGITGVGLNSILVFIGINKSSAINASLLSALNPAVTAILMFFVRGIRFSKGQILGIALSFLGVVLLITKCSFENVINLKFNEGDIFLVVAQLLWAVYTCIGQTVMKHYSGLATTTYTSLFGGLSLLPWAVSEKGWETFYIFHISPGSIGLIYTIICSGAFAFYGWNQGVKVIGPVNASIFINIIPVSGTVAAVLFLHESLTVGQIPGAILILLGLFVTILTSKN